MTRTAPAVALLALLAACQAAPIAPVPDPLPEALPWSTSEEVERGAFLGLELRDQLPKARADALLVPQVVYGYWPSNADGTDVVLWAGASRSRRRSPR